MRNYTLTGEYYTAPDRGSPNGHWYKFEHSFSVKTDQTARTETRKYLDKKYSYSTRGREDFRNLRLVRFQEVELTPVLS